MNKYLTKKNNTENILLWKSMGISDDLLKSLFNSNVPELKYPYYSYMQASFKRSCLVNENKSVSTEKVLNVYIVYHIDNSSSSFHPKLFG